MFLCVHWLMLHRPSRKKTSGARVVLVITPAKDCPTWVVGFDRSFGFAGVSRYLPALRTHPYSRRSSTDHKCANHGLPRLHTARERLPL